ncbi:hypothetical protein F4779DRAFT_631214 [Xylariaceae sp. FL0662B]|nr:hypothetical protein F4779DRAFT_631214 [Xylariaceae sp. FL0662B]
MDEPDCTWSWPAWKFGMKREELFTKLQDQYNTLAFSIQDPEAFHHDVYEVSNTASTVDEFHRMLADRKQLRLNELNQSLESASLEIIANPALIGTQQWQHALQLFRTKSLDSLVRYFASYLPDDHPWHRSTADDMNSRPFFENVDDDHDYDKAIMTHEPLPIDTSGVTIPASHLPPSPRSLTMCSDSSSASTPSRRLSFSEPESDVMVLSTTLSHGFDDETSHSDDPDTPTTSVSDISEAPSLEYHDQGDADDEDDATPLAGAAQVENTRESGTPTPRNELRSSSYVGKESSRPRPILSKYTPLERSVREGSPGGLLRARRRSPEIGRIQKPLPDAIRVRPKGRSRYGS